MLDSTATRRHHQASGRSSELQSKEKFRMETSEIPFLVQN